MNSQNETPVTADTCVVEKRKVGAPKGSKNRLRHGLYAAKPLATVSEYANRNLFAFRRALESAVLAARGEVGILDDARIQSAVELSRLAISNRELLASCMGSEKPPTLEQRLMLDAAYAKLLDGRDRKLADLGIDKRDTPPDSLASGSLDLAAVAASAERQRAAAADTSTRPAGQ